MQSFTVRAPVRADLAGGTLDLWPIYCLLGQGKTLNVALDLYADVHFEVASDADFQLHVKGVDDEQTVFDRLPSQADIELLPHSLQFPSSVVSQYLAESELPDKVIKIMVHTSAPQGSGLGGSSSLAVALTSGLARVFGHYIEQGWHWKMLHWVKDAEAAYLKLPTGTQDYLAALFGGLRCYTYTIGEITEQAFSETVLEELNDRMLILDSGQTHQSGLSNWGVFKSVFEGDTEAIGGFHAIKRIADDVAEALNASKRDWGSIGKLLSEEWEQRRATFHVQTPELEEIFSFLNKQEILGAKVCGAAQGGSLLVLTTPENRDSVQQACEDKGIRVLKTQGTLEGVHVRQTQLEPS